MSPWVRNTFLVVLPKLLLMRRPHYSPRYSQRCPADSRLTLLCCRYSVEFDDTPKPQEPSNYLDNNSKAIQ